MSTLKVDTLQDSSGSNASTTAQIHQGRAKAWVNFNGTGTVAIRDSFNVSSITDVGTGKYGVNINTAMANANYNVCVTDAHDVQVYLLMGCLRVRSDVTITTSFFQIEYLTFNQGNYNDTEECNAAVFGD
nr:hypothetical protein [uncultured Mediterranean phage uvMED]